MTPVLLVPFIMTVLVRPAQGAGRVWEHVCRQPPDLGVPPDRPQVRAGVPGRLKAPGSGQSRRGEGSLVAGAGRVGVWLFECVGLTVLACTFARLLDASNNLLTGTVTSQLCGLTSLR